MHHADAVPQQYETTVYIIKTPPHLTVTSHTAQHTMVELPSPTDRNKAQSTALATRAFVTVNAGGHSIIYQQGIEEKAPKHASALKKYKSLHAYVDINCGVGKAGGLFRSRGHTKLKTDKKHVCHRTS